MAIYRQTMHLRLISLLIADLFRFSPYRTSLTFILMFIRSVTSGAGLLLIIPLLQLIGVSTDNGTNNRIMTTVTHVFQHLHLPLNLQTILASYIVLICGVALIQYSEQVVGSSLQQQYTCHLRTRLHRHLQQNQAIHHEISEQFGALKMIKSSGRETRFIDELQRIGSGLEDQNQRLTLSTARSRFLYACGAVVLFSLLLDMALTVFHVPVGPLLLLILVFARLLPMVSSLQQTWQRILHQLPAYRDVNRLLAECRAHQEDCSSDDPYIFQQAITLHQVSFQYTTQGGPVIHQLSASLPKNTTTAIMGPSGSGKSILTDLIVGLLSPTEGHIFIDDQKLTLGKAQQALNQLRGKITLIIISHQPEMHYRVDQTIVLTPSHQGMNHASHTHSSDTKAMDGHPTSIV